MPRAADAQGRIRGSVVPFAVSVVVAAREQERLIFECLSTIDDDSVDLSCAKVDFNFEGAEERRLLLFNLFDVFSQ